MAARSKKPVDHINHALRIARQHFDDGGGEGGGGGGGDGNDPRQSGDQGEGNQTDNSEAAANADMAASQSIADAQTQQVQQAQMGRTPEQGFTDLGAAIGPNVSQMGFGANFNTTPSADLGLTSTPSPQTISEYTQQRLDTPYQGTLQNAVMFPGNAFGMSYPGLVNKQNTAAGAAGFLGSLMGESGKTLDPSAINGPSIGIAQETGPRATALENVLGISPNLTGNDLRDALAGTQLAQLGFALNEVNSGGYAPTARAMATGTDPANVANVVTQNFERPSLENLISSTPTREAYAQGIMANQPSAATMPAGAYDATPASVMAALQSGVKLANTQSQNAPSQIVSGAQLVGGSASDATNDPTATAAVNAAKSILGGQEDAENVPLPPINPNDYMPSNVISKALDTVASTFGAGTQQFLDKQTQNYIDMGYNNYDASTLATYDLRAAQTAVSNNSGAKQNNAYIPPVLSADNSASFASPMASTVANLMQQQTPYIPNTPTPYASLGANFVDPRVYQNPLFSQAAATGGTIRGNNAMGNALRIAGGNKP